MKNYLRLFWYYLDQFDTSQNVIVRVIRFEFYFISFFIIFTAILSAILSYSLVLIYVPKNIAKQAIEEFQNTYNLFFQLNDNLTLTLTDFSILWDLGFFILITYLLFKIKAKLRVFVNNKLEEKNL